MGWSDTEVMCPKCFTKHNANDLEESTEYSCWSGPEVSVECPSCSFYFEVKCEHQGFAATEDFDMNGFRKAHNIKYSGTNESPRIFVDHYLHILIDGRTPKIIKDDSGDAEYDAKWENAYHEANSIWASVTSKRSGIDEDEPA